MGSLVWWGDDGRRGVSWCVCGVAVVTTSIAIVVAVIVVVVVIGARASRFGRCKEVNKRSFLKCEKVKG